jgi:hypothetical protein
VTVTGPGGTTASVKVYYPANSATVPLQLIGIL